MPKLLIGLTAAFLLFVTVSVGIVAGAHLSTGELRPFIVDIAQTVPAEITAPVELENGEIVTVTAPFTVNIELRVSIDGASKVTLSANPAQEPASIVTNTTTNALEPRTIPIGDLSWRIAKQENTGPKYVWNSNYSSYTSGRFIALEFELENLGNTPIALGGSDYDVVAMIIDESGRQFSQMTYERVYPGLCRGIKINPGLTETCLMVFDVARDLETLTLEISAEDQVAQILLSVP